MDLNERIKASVNEKLCKKGKQFVKNTKKAEYKKK